MLMQIGKYFNVDIQRLDTTDWDEVEETIKKTIRNPQSNATFGK